ncbi:hypothetical protein G9A89_023319 [Geosiphon pyriformis]|nr:hypothetical protein G9A89_023319 [Geosiphon pyriformis]
MSSKSKLKQPFKSLSANDELKYKRKYKELKKRIREMEEENEMLTLKLTRAKKNLQRLRIERSFLFDRLENSQATNESESERSSQVEGAGSEEEISSEGLLEDQPSGKRRRVPYRDPNAPKRPRNAFLLYCKKERDQAKEDNVNKGFQDVTRILSKKWHDLSNEKKQKYFDMYNKDKERYEKEMSSYVGTSLVGADSIAIPNIQDHADMEEEDRSTAADNSQELGNVGIEDNNQISNEGKEAAATSSDKESNKGRLRKSRHSIDIQNIEQFNNSIANNTNVEGENNEGDIDELEDVSEIGENGDDGDDDMLQEEPDDDQENSSEEIDELRDDIDAEDDGEGDEYDEQEADVDEREQEDPALEGTDFEENG